MHDNSSNKRGGHRGWTSQHFGRTYTLWLVQAEIQEELQLYLSFRDEISSIDWIALRGKRIILPA